MASSVVGSWFPTGYHGHFRSKSRNDFICEYRQLAKPQPPERFTKRSMQPSARHVFSHHDNRQSFLRDALIFEQGLGRKRVANQTYNFKPEFITWMPEREYVMKTLRPQVSTYKIDYKNGQKINQLLVTRPQTSFDIAPPTTTYRYAHGRDSPHKDLLSAMNNTPLSSYTRKRPKTTKPQVRETVASCLNWYVPQPPPQPPAHGSSIRPHVPSATQVTNFENQMMPPLTQDNSPPELNWPQPKGMQEGMQSAPEPAPTLVSAPAVESAMAE